MLRASGTRLATTVVRRQWRLLGNDRSEAESVAESGTENEAESKAESKAEGEAESVAESVAEIVAAGQVVYRNAFCVLQIMTA